MAGRKRHDPIVRAADGRRFFDHVVGKDPERDYVLTDPNDPTCGTDYYVGVLGYEVERHRAGGPRAAVGRATSADGTEVRSGGLVLVSCPKAERDRRDAEGQAIPNAIEKRILKDEQVDDGLRGRGVRFRSDEDVALHPHPSYQG